MENLTYAECEKCYKQFLECIGGKSDIEVEMFPLYFDLFLGAHPRKSYKPTDKIKYLKSKVNFFEKFKTTKLLDRHTFQLSESSFIATIKACNQYDFLYTYFIYDNTEVSLAFRFSDTDELKADFNVTSDQVWFLEKGSLIQNGKDLKSLSKNFFNKFDKISLDKTNKPITLHIQNDMADVLKAKDINHIMTYHMVCNLVDKISLAWIKNIDDVDELGKPIKKQEYYNKGTLWP